MTTRPWKIAATLLLGYLGVRACARRAAARRPAPSPSAGEASSLYIDADLIAEGAFDFDDDRDRSTRAGDLDAARRAELDEVGGFSVERIPRGGGFDPSDVSERGPEYAASYHQPDVEELGHAEAAPSAEAEGENWVDELMIEAVTDGRGPTRLPLREEDSQARPHGRR